MIPRTEAELREYNARLAKNLAKLKAAGTVRTHRCPDVELKPKGSQDGRKPNVKCIICEQPFYARPYVIRRGGGKFCSQLCYGEWRSRRDGK